MKSNNSLRDYGLGYSGKPVSVPYWEASEDAPPYPNCGASVCKVSVEVEHPLLKGGRGVTTYFGCPACPFASPAVAVASSTEGRSK